jgi:serine/threonine-protein kinase
LSSKFDDPHATLLAPPPGIEAGDGTRATTATERPPAVWPADPGPVPGTVLGGKYRIERVLGAGGIAVVAAAYHLQLRCRVAIKYLLAEALEYPEIVERFSREARAAARIRGEHVARVIDVGVFDDGAPFIVLEYLDGQDLADLLEKEGPLGVPEAVRYVLQACSALAEAHAAKIVHRDLKPANLFLAKGPDRRKKIKVLDFGVSKIVDEPMTEPARILGTVAYMSPEQLEGSSNVDARSDIWSLGVILYELLAGYAPFRGQTLVLLAQTIRVNAPEPLSTIRADVPAALDAVVRSCMRTRPEERPPSVLDLALALAPFADRRDRDSVRTIAGVLNGSMAPPPPEVVSGSMLTLPVPPPLPTPSAEARPMPLHMMSLPIPLTSEAPVSTDVDTLDDVPLVVGDGDPSHSVPTTRWIGRRVVIAAGLFAAALILAVVAPTTSPSATAPAEPPPPTDVKLPTPKPMPSAAAHSADGGR